MKSFDAVVFDVLRVPPEAYAVSGSAALQSIEFFLLIYCFVTFLSIKNLLFIKDFDWSQKRLFIVNALLSVVVINYLFE